MGEGRVSNGGVLTAAGWAKLGPAVPPASLGDASRAPLLCQMAAAAAGRNSFLFLDRVRKTTGGGASGRPRAAGLRCSL